MTSGGARSRSGPAPDPNSARSDAAGWTTIPIEGRGEPAPDWPLTEATDRELVLWGRWWRKPEAVLWGVGARVDVDYVALTVRMFSEAEVTKASAENRKTVRLMMSDCFLTDDSKARARIRVGVVEEKPAKSTEQPARPRRLRAVPDAQ